jgi:hypothetical protein
MHDYCPAGFPPPTALSSIGTTNTPSRIPMISVHQCITNLFLLVLDDHFTTGPKTNDTSDKENNSENNDNSDSDSTTLSRGTTNPTTRVVTVLRPTVICLA